MEEDLGSDVFTTSGTQALPGVIGKWRETDTWKGN